MNRYADCSYCGGEVVEQTIEYDYRRQKHLMVVSNVPPPRRLPPMRREVF